MCRAEISQEDCTKVKETFSTIAHRREVDLKQRKKEKETMERQQLKKQQLERQARLKQEKKERDKREEAHVLGLAGVAQRQAEEVAKMEQLKKDQAAARIVLQKKQNQEKAEKNKLLKAKKAKKKEALRQEKLKANAKTLATDKPVELESEPRQRKKKKKQPRQQRKDREEQINATKAKTQRRRVKHEKRSWWSNFAFFGPWILLAVTCILIYSMFTTSTSSSRTSTSSRISRSKKYSPKNLYDASFRGQVKKVKKLLKKFSWSREKLDINLLAPLNAACQENHLKIVKLHKDKNGPRANHITLVFRV
jgi:thiol:disulfide interchange protein